jgi:hypothetical protein
MTLKALKPLSKEEPVSAPVETAPTAENTGIDTSAKPLSSEQLLAIIVSLQQENAKANAALANAILETTKPREVLKSAKELANEANDELFKKNEKEYRQRERAANKYNQDNCDHVAGGNQLSEQRDIAGRTSIVWHRTDTGADVGICTNCGRQFHPLDSPDEQGHSYVYWRKKPSFNKLSASGNRQFANPSKAMSDAYLRDS